MVRFRLVMAAVACWLVLAAASGADAWRCPKCGCCRPPCLTKRLVPGVERSVRWEYFQHCETWSVQGPSRCVGNVPKECIDPSKLPQYDKVWEPRCGPTFTARRLWKRPVVCERSVLHCVFEATCPECGLVQTADKATSQTAWISPNGSQGPLQVSTVRPVGPQMSSPAEPSGAGGLPATVR